MNVIDNRTSIERLREIIRLTQMLERSTERRRTFKRAMLIDVVIMLLAFVAYMNDSWLLLGILIGLDVLVGVTMFCVSRYVELNLARVLERTALGDVESDHGQ